jgi:DNA-directed RNA polymerase specialized sigma24 family protein
VPPGDVSLNDALERLRHLSQSHQGAWAVLYRACYPHVLWAARRRINHRLRSTYDADDFVSDVMLDLLRDIDCLEYPSLDALIIHLQLQTERKVRDAIQRCRDST